MHHLFATARRGVATALLMATALCPADMMAGQVATARQDGETNHRHESGPADSPKAGSAAFLPEGSTLMVPAYVPLFASSEDAQAFWDMAVQAYLLAAPDPRTVAKAFIKEQLDIDGDAYVVAHFATPQLRSAGKPDRAILLTDAMMMAFPEHSRYSFFGTVTDAVNVVTGGVRESPDMFPFVGNASTCETVEGCFLRVGRSLWSGTVQGYIYKILIGKGNVREVVYEDLRSLDEAFGIYPSASTFAPEQASTLRLSQVIDKFKEEGLFAELPYIKRLRKEYQRYWSSLKPDWPLLARYWFVHRARWAKGNGILTQAQYELVMKGGAPNVPLTGAIALRQLRNTPPLPPVKVRRVDINGYAASDLLRFIDADGSEVLYVPDADSPFIPFSSESAFRQWVVRQAAHPGTLDAFLSHFSIYNRQDGVFWTGVAHGLIRLGHAQWKADSSTIDQDTAVIAGDVFQDMLAQVETRQRDDARMQTRMAWDAWRGTFNRTATLLGPLSYAPPLAIPIQAGSALFGLGTGLDQSVHGRTAKERKDALEQAVMTVVTTSAATALGSGGASTRRTETPVSVLPGPVPASLQRVNGRIGYLLGGVNGPRLPGEQVQEGQQVPEAQAENEGIRHPPSTEEENPRRRVFDPLAEHDERQPPAARSLDERGYLVMTVPSDGMRRARQVIDLKKIAIEEMRHRLDDFRTGSLATNAAGSRLSFDQSLVYRVDDRTPQQLLASGGFGPSREFNAISRMLRQPATIGSGSLVASNLVLRHWQRTFRNREAYHQYAIWTDGRTDGSSRAGKPASGKLRDTLG